ncbi:hypothetical protein PTTG_04823 [Puccinia triticina 1-1 BBBD Race 1]|uniref:Uncharacterized protein n=1 Tax=Puccinia triticina (isolate 1-1 / race 1 (BBBD)) TaxID=630390 RepID=A0A0C4EVI8_PUCT1|nr:hypothetical protein PTTG_04823 [Puccinia triticina 1-1 BBBD Race 1]WAR62074.1 hypothetical protein PtB15_14B168 [Puccinia triticina]
MGIEPSPHSSIRRKTKGSSIGGINGLDSHGPSSNHRQSLAFELAAAMEPEENDQASILEQLGLGDDDDEGLGEDQDEVDDEADDQEDTIYEEEEYPGPDRFDPSDDQSSLQFLEPQRLRLQPSRSTIGSTSKRYSGASTFGSSCSPRKSSIREPSLSTPMRTLGRELSRSTLNTIDPTSPSNIFDESGHPIDPQHEDPSQIEDDEEAGIFGSRRSPEDLEPSEDEDAEILQAGLESTAKFLNLLKQSNTDCPASMLTPKAPDSQQPQALSPSTPTTPTRTRAMDESRQTDRQPVVEKMITDIVRTMTEQVRDRESQIRELKEIEIALSRTDRRFLADLEELPDLFEERDFRNSTILGKSLVTQPDHPSSSRDGSPKPLDDLEQLDPHDHEHVEVDEVDLEDELEGGRLTPTGGGGARDEKRSSFQTDSLTDLSHQGRGTTKKVDEKRSMENLGELKLITSSLIHSLNQIHEHTQISRQTQIEIVRKLKGVKGLVANWKTDFDSIQNSIDFISNWELDQFRGPNDSQETPLRNCRREKIRGIFEVQVKLATSEVEKLLDDAFANASVLLQQPHPTAPSLIN